MPRTEKTQNHTAGFPVASWSKVGLYQAVPVVLADGTVTYLLTDDIGQLRIAGYNQVDEVVSTEVTNQHSQADSGIQTFLNGVTNDATSASFNSFMYSQFHIHITAVTGDATGTGDIYLDTSVDNTNWTQGVLSQNVPAGAAATYNYDMYLTSPYNYIRFRFVRGATTITVTVEGIGRGTR